MNKTVNINLSGIIFHLDEQAYDAFKKYLSEVKSALLEQEGGTEIVADIEARIAELFSTRLEKGNREVVSSEDVEYVIEKLGRPEAFRDEEAEENRSTYQGRTKTSKRLFRNPDEKIIGGVASGVAAYFGTDVVWIRLLFLILLFFTGIGFITYIILWAAIPEAKTTAQKLQMRGEPVNLGNIEKSVKEELEGVKERIGRFREDNNGQSAGSQLANNVNRFLNFLLSVIENIIKFVIKFIGIILGFVAVVLGFVLFLGLTGVIASTWNVGGLDFISIDGAVIGVNGAQAIFGDGYLLHTLRIGTILTLLFPLFGLIIFFARTMGKPMANAKYLSIAGGISFIIGLGLLIYSGSGVARSFKVGATEMETIALNGIQFDLQADLLEDSESFLFELDDDRIRIENVRLNIRKTFDSTASLVLKHRARGNSNSDARNRAQQFEYPVEQTGSILTLNEYFSVPKDAMYRAQELNATLYLPVGSEVFLDPSVENVIFDIDNVHNMWDGDMVGHTWKMEKKGLVCLDCQRYEYFDEEELVEEIIEEIEDNKTEALENLEEEIEELELKLKELRQE